MKVVRSKDCGNSPKNQVVEDLAVALATGDTTTVARLVADDADWGVVGVRDLHGRQAIVDVIARAGTSASKLTVTHVLSHGKAGAVNGVIEHKGGATHFCDMFEFANAKGTSIARITSYRIES